MYRKSSPNRRAKRQWSSGIVQAVHRSPEGEYFGEIPTPLTRISGASFPVKRGFSAASIAAEFPRSTSMHRTLGLAEHNASAPDTSRSARRTDNPRLANAVAMPRPIPPQPPVMRTDFPRISRPFILLPIQRPQPLLFHCCRMSVEQPPHPLPKIKTGSSLLRRRCVECRASRHSR